MSGSTTGPDYAQTDYFTVLRTLLMRHLPDGMPVVRGQQNRAGQPGAADFAVTWEIASNAISTPVETYFDSVPNNGTVSLTNILLPTERTVQIDVHGPASANNAQRIHALARSLLLSEEVAAITEDVAILYADDPRQVPFENAEMQTEQRWTIDLHVQVNGTISVTQQFFDEAHATLLEVDAAYPP